MTEPPRVRAVQVGAGRMGRTWLRAIGRSRDVQLVGLVDVAPATAREALAEELPGYADVRLGADLEEMLDAVGADAVINVTIPEAHLPINSAVMQRGLDVLCEKPIGTNMVEAVRSAALSESTGRLLMISQSRHYLDGFRAFQTGSAALGRLASLQCRFHKSMRFGGFRDEMPYPLLVDMAIHHFDAARAILGADPVSVYCDSYNPPWSWYAGDASATAVFRFADGVRFTYQGSWCTPGLETSWNGEWSARGENGAAQWDGEQDPVLETDAGVRPELSEPRLKEIDGSLSEFVGAVREGIRPWGEALSNAMSLAMVEAAVTSARRRVPVEVEEIVSSALSAAVLQESSAEARAVLAGWIRTGFTHKRGPDAGSPGARERTTE